MPTRKKTPRLRTVNMDLGFTEAILKKMREARAKAIGQNKLVTESLTLLRREHDARAVKNQFRELRDALENGTVSRLEQEIPYRQPELHLLSTNVFAPKSRAPSFQWIHAFDVAQKRRIAKGNATVEEAVLFDNIDPEIKEIALNKGALQKERIRVITQLDWARRTELRQEVVSENGFRRYTGKEMKLLRILNDLLKMHRVAPVDIYGKIVRQKNN